MKNEARKGRIVEPFNDVYTHDCFMNTLLCAARFYHLDYPMLTLHKGFSYFMVGEQICSHSVALLPIDGLALAIGLEMNKEKDCIEDWKDEYKTQLEQDAIIVAPIDDYYNPLRIDVYQKEHLLHYILIYSMDNVNEILSVIESRYRTTVLYKNMEMKYNDFEKSHFQFKTLYKYVYKENNYYTKTLFKKEYIHSFIKLTEQSICNLNKYICYLKTNEVIDKKEWLKNINDICNHVRIEQYVFDKVFCNNDISGIVADIYQTWYLLRTQVVKLLLVGQSNDILTKNITYLKRIENLENNKRNILCSFSL